MTFNSEVPVRKAAPGNSPRTGKIHKHAPLISPSTAWRILHRRTGGHVSRSTFYRWLESGKIHSLRLGSRIYIPWQELQEVIDRCLNGEPL
jgi:excisionase family DNA binding protein